MIRSALKTLFLPIEQAILHPANPALFLGAEYHSVLENLQDADLIQTRVDLQKTLKSRGLSISDTIPENKAYPFALCLLPKQKQEAQSMLAQAAKHLTGDGTLVAAAANHAGGTRLESWMKTLGFSPQSYSKHKCRVAWGQGTPNTEIMHDWITQGAPRQIDLDGLTGWWTQPGVFGWNKIDRGSRLLTDYIPDDLRGHVADFGCGTGYLSHYLQAHCPKMKNLTAIDVDHRAVNLCARNVPGANAHAADLSITDPDLDTFDHIIMNPPFHDGKDTQADLGLSMIRTAHHHLKAGGSLIMVANAHLGYEKTLKTLFTKPEKFCEQDGFKIFSAVK